MAFTMKNIAGALGLGGSRKTADIKDRVRQGPQKTGGISPAGLALSQLSDSEGDKTITRAELFEVLDALNLRGMPQGYRADVDAVTAATTSISTDGNFEPGGCAVHILASKGPETVQVNSRTAGSHISSAALGGDSLMKGNIIPYWPVGNGYVCLVPFGESGGRTYTATSNQDFSTGDVGTVKTIYFATEAEGWEYINRYTG